MSCANPVQVFVPKGWDYKQITMECGQTGIDGEPVRCAACASKRPWYICAHGVDMRPEGAFCGACEFE